MSAAERDLHRRLEQIMRVLVAEMVRHPPDMQQALTASVAATLLGHVLRQTPHPDRQRLLDVIGTNAIRAMAKGDAYDSGTHHPAGHA